MFVSFCICYYILLAVFLQKIFYILIGFITNLSSNSIWLIFSMWTKVSCIAPYHSYDVFKQLSN